MGQAREETAQTRLELQNEKLQAIIDNIPVMLCFYDPDGNVAMINEGFHRILGFSLEDFRNDDIMTLCYPDPEYRQQVWDYMMSAEPQWKDLLVQSKHSGKIASSWANVRLSDGSYIGIGIDIRQRKRYENRITSSEERYRTLVELSPDGIGVERQGIIRFVNSTACTLLGAEQPEALIGRSILDFIYPDYRRRAERQLEILRQRRKALQGAEAKVVCLDGSLLDVELSGMPISYEGRPATQIIVRDITQRKTAERESHEARRFAESIIGTIQEALVVLDAQLNVLSANHAFYETFAVAPEDTEGRRIYEIGNRQWDQPELRRLLEEILPCNTSFKDFEVEYNFEHIGCRTMLLNARRIHRETEKTQMILLAIRDITLRKQQEQAILDNQQQLADLTEELLLTEERERRRVATVLHDSIGQSLAFAKRELGALRQDLPERLSAKLDQVSTQIEESIRQTRSLTFDLSPATLYTFGLEAAVEELTEQLAQQGGFQYRLEIQDGDKPLSEQAQILLYRSTRELLINVMKHAAAQNVSVRIERVNGNVRIQVKDDGRGFDTTNLEPIQGKRMSFGLFSIRQRLQHTKGSLTVDSKPGTGTRVTMQIPLLTADGDEPQTMM